VAVVLGKRGKRTATILLELSWDPKVEKFGPTPAMIMSVLETAPYLHGLKIRSWGFVDVHRRTKKTGA
jgi:hypothetical protein